MTHASSSLDVLVVGAGPTGLALAAQLQTYGVRFRVIDRLVDRARESRALAVQARTLELLQTCGLGERLVARGNTSTRLKLHMEGRAVGVVTLGDIGAVDTRFPYILFVSQAETEAALDEYLTGVGVAIERGTELVSQEQRNEGIQCLLNKRDGSEERLHARFLVGCDGAHSTVRKQSGFSFEGGSYPQDFALGDVEANGPLEPNAINSFAGGGGVAMFFPLGRPTTWRVIAMTTGQQTDRQGSSEIVRDIALSDLQALVDRPTMATVRVHSPAWLTRFHLHHRQTASYRAGNVFLAGDAAHIHSPVGAQGMNTGIQDSWNLGWKLGMVVRGFAQSSLLDTYEAERWPVGQFLLRYTDRLFSTFTGAMADRPLATWARRTVVPFVVPRLFGSPWIRRTAFAFVSELGIRYRRSPAVAEGDRNIGDHLRAGDRLPDAEVLANGNATFLQQAVAGPRLALLLCGDPRNWDGAEVIALQQRWNQVIAAYYVGPQRSNASIVDRTGSMFERLGVHGSGQFLVRPDGYIAFCSGGTLLVQLEKYLSRWYRN